MIFNTLYFASLLALTSAHGVILGAQGDVQGSPSSVGFKVDAAIARNCTGISPCQQDTTIIRDAEITANIVNECGRTELSGNIDVGEETENALAAGAVTQVTAGGSMTITIHQVNADGAGPYTCDIDQTSNSGVLSQNLTVTNNVPGVNGLSQAKTQDFDITVALPDNLACTGASTGNICTVRCRNAAVAGPFGGCVAVQQTDITAAVNSPNQLQTAQTLDGINKQVAQNVKDLPAAIAANQQSGLDQQGKAAVDALLSATVVSSASPVQTPDLENVGQNKPGAVLTGTAVASATATNAAGGGAGAIASTTSSAAAVATGGNGNTNNGNGNGNGNGGGRNRKNGNNNNNNNNKARRSSMRWAKRMDDGNL